MVTVKKGNKTQNLQQKKYGIQKIPGQNIVFFRFVIFQQILTNQMLSCLFLEEPLCFRWTVAVTSVQYDKSTLWKHVCQCCCLYTEAFLRLSKLKKLPIRKNERGNDNQRHTGEGSQERNNENSKQGLNPLVKGLRRRQGAGEIDRTRASQRSYSFHRFQKEPGNLL